MKAKGVIFDLDDTLVDTHQLKELRDRRKWRDAVAHLSRTRVFPGIGELLVQLSQRRIPFAVVTTSVSFYAENLLRHHGILPQALVAYHDAPPKPSPRPILLALTKLQVAAKDTVGIGDQESDCVAYNAAGVFSIGAAWSPAFSGAEWRATASLPATLDNYLMGRA